MSIDPKRRYVKLNASERLAVQLLYIGITGSKVSEERIAQIFNVVRLTVRSLTVAQGLTRGSLDVQIGRLRQLYEAVAGPVGNDAEWGGVFARARQLALAKLNEPAARDAQRAA